MSLIKLTTPCSCLNWVRSLGYRFYKHSLNRRGVEYISTDFYVPEETDYRKTLKGNPLSCLTTMYDRSVIGDLYF